MGRTVLYLHGFQEDAGSPKPLRLREMLEAEGHTFRFVSLGMFFTKWNSPVRFALTTGVGLWCLAAGTALWFAAGPWWGVGLYAASMLTLRNSVVRTGIEGSFERTMQIATAAVEEHKPDVIMAFSWGGALALEMKQRHNDTRPLLLLAPAFYLLQRLRDPLLDGPRHPALDRTLPHGRVVFVHSTDDPLCPFDETVELMNHIPNATLHRVEGEGHPLWGTVTSGVLERAAGEVMDGL